MLRDAIDGVPSDPPFDLSCDQEEPRNKDSTDTIDPSSPRDPSSLAP